MNALVPVNMGQVATVFANSNPDAGDLSAGVSGGFGHIGYKGKVWSVRYRGEEVQLMREDGDGPRNSIELVILKASPAVAKIFYENGYVEGANAAPDCFSTNGVTPDPGAAKKQSVACANCPKGAWGSRITPEGKQGKACGDSRRLAVVPLQDIKNEVYGGPMLLRVPAASLQDLAQFGQKMAGVGYPYYAIGVRVAFDPASAFPKFQFGAIRALSNEEATLVLEMQKTPEVSRILAEGSEVHAPLAAQAQLAPPSPFEQPPVQTLAAPQVVVPQPVMAAPPVAQPAPVAAPAPATSGFGATSAPTKVTPPAQNNVVPMTAPVAAPAQSLQPVTSGFGATAPAAPPASAPQVAAPVVAPAGGSSFEAALDAQLGDLLPPV